MDKRFFSTVLTASLAAPAMASDWVLVSSSAEANLYVDLASIHSEGRLKKALTLLDSPVEQQSGKGFKYKSATFISYYDCGGQQLAPIDTAYYQDRAGKGQTVHSAKSSADRAEYLPVTPGTKEQDALRFVCAYWTEEEIVRPRDLQKKDRVPL